MGLAWPIIDRMLHHHLKIAEEEEEYELDPIDQFKSIVGKDLKERWNDVMSCSEETVLLSIFLDPRLKDFAFIEDAIKRRQLVDRSYRFAYAWLCNPDKCSPLAIDPDQVALQATTQDSRSKINRIFGDGTASRSHPPLARPTKRKSSQRIITSPRCRWWRRRTWIGTRTPWNGGQRTNRPFLVSPRWPGATSPSLLPPCPPNACFRGEEVSSPKNGLLCAAKNTSMLMFIVCNRHHLTGRQEHNAQAE